MKTKMKLAAGFSVAMLVGCVAATAQTAPAAPKGWETSANAGLTLTRGNSHTVLTTVGLDSKRKWEKDEAMLGISGGYGKNSGARSTDFIQAYGQFNHLISDRAFFGLRVDGNHDGISDLAYRVTISPLLGYYLVKEEKTTLSVEAGPSVVIEKFEGGTTDTYLAARFGEKFEHKLSATTKIWQTLDYIPKVDDWANKYLLIGEVGISTAITPKWDLRVVLQDNYDSQPQGTRKNNDVRLIAGTGYKF